MKILKNVLLLSAILPLLLTCTTEEVIFDMSEQLVLDIKRVDDFLLDNNIEAQKHPSGFSYIVTEEGTGESIFNYCRWTLKLTVFHLDSTYAFSNYPEVEREQGFDFPFFEKFIVHPCYGPRRPLALHSLNELIKEGGKIQLFLPSGLAWSAEGFFDGYSGSSQRRPVEIPANTNMLITAELIDVEE
jgi:hypothetical protein